VAGGGATEMELSRGLRENAIKVAGKEQLVMNMFAKALEVIPRTIADNAGLDSLDIINKLRTKHCKSDVT
jgi:T-complex protein 1 subunit eta